MFLIRLLLTYLKMYCLLMMFIIIVVVPLELLFVEPRICDKIASGKCFGILIGNCYATYSNDSLVDDMYLCEHCYKHIDKKNIKKMKQNYYCITHKNKKYWFNINKWQRKLCDKITFDKSTHKLFCYSNNILLYELSNIENIYNKFKWRKHLCMIFNY